MNATTLSSGTMAILSLDRLDNYYCKTPSSMGIEVYGWFKLFKKVNREDTVVLRIDTEGIDANQPYATIFIYNPAKQVLVDYQVFFLNIVLEKFVIPDKDFDAVVSVPSIELFKVLRWCETDAMNVRIYTCEKFDRTYLVVETALRGGSSDVSTAAVKVMINVTGKTTGAGCANVVSPNLYKLDHLLDIARSGSMNVGGNAILYLTRDPYPLVVDYSVGTMGNIKYCLCPLVNEYDPSITNEQKSATVLSDEVQDMEAVEELEQATADPDDDNIFEHECDADDDEFN